MVGVVPLPPQHRNYINKKSKFVSHKLSRRSELRELGKKTNSESFREERIVTCLASCDFYTTPRKIPGIFQPLLPATSAHTDSTFGPPAPTACLAPHSRQAKLALILTRRHMTDHRREHGGSKRELAYGADAELFRLLSVPYL